MSLEIAKTIIEQLGGHKFQVMTGAKQFIGYEDGVKFRLPRSCNKINTIKITLTPLDLYHVEFFFISLKTCKSIATEENVYAEDLQRLFTTHTGLYTHL